MNNKFNSLYVCILKELWSELQRAEAVYFEMLQTLLKCLKQGALESSLAVYEKCYQHKLSVIISDLGTVYSGRIELFPVPENSEILQRMEIWNRQFEELERILKNIFAQKNIEPPENKIENKWKKLIKQIEKNFTNIEYNNAADKQNSCFFKPNILVCGQSSVGKTSLIRAVTLHGTVPDDAIGYNKVAQNNFALYETPIADFIEMPEINSGNAGSDIHHIWYCIDGSGTQLSLYDTELIKKFSNKLFLIVTKCDLMNKEQNGAVMDHLSGLISCDRIIMVSAESKTGLPQLISRTENSATGAMAAEALEIFRERWKNYYSDMQKNWAEIASDEADNCIYWTENRETPPLTADNIYMIYKLAAIYGFAIDNTVIDRLMEEASCIGKAAKAYFASGIGRNISE